MFQIPFYRGERITFDVAPSRMDFRVEHNSLKLEVSLQCSSFLLGCYLWVKKSYSIAFVSCDKQWLWYCT